MTFLSNLIIHEEGQYLTGSLEGFVGGFHWIIIFFLLLVSLSLYVFPLTGDMLETPQHFMSFILQLLSLSSLWNTILGSSHTHAWGGRIRAIPTQWCQREPRVERPGWSREFRAGWIPHICTLSSLFETLPVFLIWTYTNGAEFMAENKHSCPPLGVTVSQWEIFRNIQEYSGMLLLVVHAQFLPSPSDGRRPCWGRSWSRGTSASVHPVPDRLVESRSHLLPWKQ